MPEPPGRSSSATVTKRSKRARARSGSGRTSRPRKAVGTKARPEAASSSPEASATEDEAEVLAPDGDEAILEAVRASGLAPAAETEGADYLFFGTGFPSRSHPDAQASGVAGVAAAAGAVSIPVIGIGGITTRNCKGVIDAGASPGSFHGADLALGARRCHAEALAVT